MLLFLGYLFIILGTISFSISAIGLIRMPDVYSRMHVGAKSTTIGILLIILGAVFLEPSWTMELTLLAIFILLTNPLSSSVIGRATHKISTPHLNLKVDEFKEFSEQQS